MVLEVKSQSLLDRLYIAVSAYAADKTGEIERLAETALKEGVINDRMYEILRWRTPFNGYEKETVKEVASRFGVRKQAISQSQKKAVLKLIRYIPRTHQDLLKMSIDYLRWGTDVNSSKALGALKRNLGTEVTVSGVIEFFEAHARQKKPITLSNYGPIRGQTTYETFNRAGIKLPEVRIV